MTQKELKRLFKTIWKTDGLSDALLLVSIILTVITVIKIVMSECLGKESDLDGRYFER